MKEFGLILIEKPLREGLNREEILGLLEHTSEEVLPIEIEAKEHESSAMGFITIVAADMIDWDYEGSGLNDFIVNILDDMNNESANGTYEFMGIRILLTR